MHAYFMFTDDLYTTYVCTIFYPCICYKCRIKSYQTERQTYEWTGRQTDIQIDIQTDR